MRIPQPPSNLIPVKMSQLPDAPAGTTADSSLLWINFEGVDYKISAASIVSITGVPTSRQVIAGTGMTGGGTLENNVTLSIANGGVGYGQLADSGITAGVYGSATMIPVINVDSKGRVISVVNTSLTVSGYVPESRQIIAGEGLTGGGSLSANVTLLASLSDETPLLGSGSGSAGVSTSMSRSDHKHPRVDLNEGDQIKNVLGVSHGGTGQDLTPIPGAIVRSGSDGLYIGDVGTSGQVLVSNGTNPYGWVSQSGLNVGQASNLGGGTANRIPCQTGVGITSFIVAPTTTDTVLSWNGSSFVWSSGGTGSVSSVSATSPVFSTGGSTPVISISQSTISTSGYLSSSDWATFNSKQSALGYVPVNKVGDTMTGMLTLPASGSSLVPLHLSQGTTPNTVIDGDIWFDQNGIYIKNLSAIHQLDADANSVGALTNAVITNNGDGTINVGAIDVFIYALASWQGDYARRTVPAVTSLALTDNIQNFLTVIYNGGSPIYNITTTASSVNNSNVLLIATMWREGTKLHYNPVNWGLATATRLNDRLINIQRYVRSSGLSLGESTGNVATVTSGLIWYGIKAFSESAVTSASSNMDFYYRVGGNWTMSVVSSYNITQYDNGTSLQTLSNAHYTVNWVYRYIDGASNPKLAIHLGASDYSTASAASGAAQPTPPPILPQMAILVGRIIVQKNASTASQIDSAFTSVFSGTAVTDHNNLAGLQGGTTNEYYHLTSADYAGTGMGVLARKDSPVFTTNITTPIIKPAADSTTAVQINKADGTTNVLNVDTTNSRVGIGTTSPGSTIDIKGTLRLSGATSGYIELSPAADAGTTTYTLPSADGTSGQVLSTNGSGVLSWATGGSGSSQWTTSGSNIYYNTGNVGIGTASPGGTLSVLSSNIAGATTSSALNLSANSLTSGTGLYAASSTLSSGSLVDLQVSGAAAASNTQKALNILTAGANGTSTQTTYGTYVSNTHTGTSSTNVAGYFSASGGSNNYGLLVGAGNVGIGTTTPASKLDIKGAGITTGITLQTQGSGGAVGLRVQDNGKVSIGSFTSPLAKLNINGGDTTLAFINPTLVLGFSTTGDYPHFIHTRHNTTAAGNTIDIYTCDGTSNGTYPTNAVHGLTITNGTIGVGGVTTPIARVDIKGAGTTTGIALQTQNSAGTVKFKVQDNGVVILSAFTVGTLPTGAIGMRAYVTDATAPTYGETLTGGGAVTIPVFYNGTAWISA